MQQQSVSHVPRSLLITVVLLVLVNGKIWAQTAGTLDASFGTNGKVITTFSPPATANGMAIQADGKIVVAGSSNSTADFTLARYNPDGTLDTSFNSTGKVITNVNNTSDEALAVVVQSDGKILAGGYAFVGTRKEFALVRYNSDGTLDTSFGGTGKVISEMPGKDSDSEIRSLALQSDGKILAGGGLRVPGFGSTPPTNEDHYRVVLARYDTSGALDSSFFDIQQGFVGIITDEPLSFRTSQYLGSLAVQPDGYIVAGVQPNAVARYTSDGPIDVSFGTDGHVLNVGSSVSAVALQSDGKIVVVGQSSASNFLITRLGSDGTFDSSFGQNGQVSTDFGDFDWASSVTVLGDGHIVAGGYISSSTTGTRNFALARYNSDGSLDPLFGTNGLVITDVNGSDDRITGIGIQSDGKLVAAGPVVDLSQSSFAFGVARYLMKEPTTTAVSSSLNPSSFGQAVTFTANVSSLYGSPSGTVEFRDGIVFLGSAVLNSGVATFTTSALGAGTHSIIAAYLGTPIFLASTSAALNQTVSAAATTTTLTSNPNPSSVGQVVTFTATVTVLPPATATVTGTVDFFDGTTKLNSTGVRVLQGVAVFSTTSLAKGNHYITAVYSGARNIGGSTSAELRQQVKQ